MFAEYLVDVFTPYDDTIDREVSEYLDTDLAMTPNITMLMPKQIETEISRLSTRKAPGIDHVSPLMLKEISRKGIVLLTYLFNAILRLQYWPKKTEDC